MCRSGLSRQLTDFSEQARELWEEIRHGFDGPRVPVMKIAEALKKAVEDEREACAKVADEFRQQYDEHNKVSPLTIATAIRSRRT